MLLRVPTGQCSQCLLVHLGPTHRAAWPSLRRTGPSPSGCMKLGGKAPGGHWLCVWGQGCWQPHDNWRWCFHTAWGVLVHT